MLCPWRPVPCLTNKWLKSPCIGMVCTSKISFPRWRDMLLLTIINNQSTITWHTDFQTSVSTYWATCNIEMVFILNHIFNVWNYQFYKLWLVRESDLPSDQRTTRALLSLMGLPSSSVASVPSSLFFFLQRIVFSTCKNTIQWLFF